MKYARVGIDHDKWWNAIYTEKDTLSSFVGRVSTKGKLINMSSMSFRDDANSRREAIAILKKYFPGKVRKLGKCTTYPTLNWDLFQIKE